MGNVHRLVVVGGGVAGMDLATRLSKKNMVRGELAVTLVDRESAHVWKPMLHTIAAGTREVSQLQTPYIAQARDHGFAYQPGELVGIDGQRRTLYLGRLVSSRGQEILPEREITYDTLILTLGSCADDFGIPGVAQYCHTIDSRSQAIAFSEAVRVSMLRSAANGRSVRIAIVGGGATGVELAAELVRLSELIGSYGSASGISGKVEVVLLESNSRLLTAFPERISEAARTGLQNLGVEVKTGIHVTAADAHGFRYGSDQSESADLTCWAAGIRAPRLLAAVKELKCNKTSQVFVQPNLRSDDECIYAIGDCSSLTPSGAERPLPPTAQVASQQASYLIEYLPQLLANRAVPAFKYRDFGSLVSLGGYDAYGSLGKFGFFKGGFIQGRAAQLGHALLYRQHQARLHGFWHGSILWLIDWMNDRVRPSVKLD